MSQMMISRPDYHKLENPRKTHSIIMDAMNGKIPEQVLYQLYQSRLDQKQTVVMMCGIAGKLNPTAPAVYRLSPMS
jgi:hypothetical protein